MRGTGAFHRAPRPLIMWAGVILVVAGIAFVVAVGAAIAVGFWLTVARGQPAPTISGNDLAAVGGAIATVGAFVMQVFSQRHRERMDQQARGLAPDVPFDPGRPSPPPPPPSSDEPLINPHGGPTAP